MRAPRQYGWPLSRRSPNLIDPRDLQAALDQANAQAQRDQASLEYAKANFGRGEELVKSGFVTKDAYDQRASSMHQVEAQLVLDHAAIDAAKLNLGYTEIRAPFAGRLGRNQAAKGALVGPARAGETFFFSTGNPDGKMATGSRPSSGGNIEIESADDFVLTQATNITPSNVKATRVAPRRSPRPVLTLRHAKAHVPTLSTKMIRKIEKRWGGLPVP